MTQISTNDAWNTRPAETALLARVREKIEAARKPYYMPNIDHDEGIDDALRAVDEVEKEMMV